MSHKNKTQNIPIRAVSDGINIPQSRGDDISHTRKQVYGHLGFHRVTGPAMKLICSRGLVCPRGTAFDGEIIRGGRFSPEQRHETDIRLDAKRQDLTAPLPEAAYAVFNAVTASFMRLHGLKTVIVMHQPLVDSANEDSLFVIECIDRHRHLSLFGSSPEYQWFENDGFFFVKRSSAPQIVTTPINAELALA